MFFLQIAFYRTFVVNLPHVVTLLYICRMMFCKLGPWSVAVEQPTIKIRQ